LTASNLSGDYRGTQAVDAATEPTHAIESWPALPPIERRVLGVLVEKAKTTPDVYPMSLNALVTGSNQKSNRDPVMNLSEPDVEDALLTLQKRGLVNRIQGGRVDRWRHLLYETWRVNKVELAVLGELLLRGAQTEGELRSRASRMEPIEDLEALRPVLKRLAERKLIVFLTPEGRRGTMLTHGFHSADELERLKARCRDLPSREDEAMAAAPTLAAPSSIVSTPSVPPTPLPMDQEHWNRLEHNLAACRGEVSALREEIERLRAEHAELVETVARLREALGG
jgi:uncharacterized protein YceH (UPF0502 family)